MKCFACISVVIMILMQSHFTCGQATPEVTYHVVKKNESARQISQFYNVPVDSIRKWNYLDRNYRVDEGMKLTIKHIEGFVRFDAARNNLQLTIQEPKTTFSKTKPQPKVVPSAKQTPTIEPAPVIQQKVDEKPEPLDKPTPIVTISTEKNLSAGKDMVQMSDHSGNNKSETVPDTLQTGSQPIYLQLLSDAPPKIPHPTFLGRVMYYYYESNYLIKFIIFLNLFFLLSSIFLALYVIYRRIRQGYVDFKKAKCQDRYRDFIMDWLYEEHTKTVPSWLVKELKDSIYREVFTAELLSLHNNLTGESAEKLVDLFHLVGFKNYSIQKVKRSFWHLKARGFRELAQMKIKENFMIFKYLNSGNVTLSIEAQLAWIQLNPDDPLSFYDDPNVKLTEWGQLNLLLALKKSGRIPDFGRWLKSVSKSVSLFALKMAGNYKQFDNVELVTQRLDDSDSEIRREAIRTLGKMAMPSQAAVLKELYPKEELENKTEIVRSLIMMSEFSNFSFFADVLLNETDINLRILAAKGLISSGEEGQRRLESIYFTADELLRKIIIHAKDNRI